MSITKNNTSTAMLNHNPILKKRKVNISLDKTEESTAFIKTIIAWNKSLNSKNINKK